MNYVVEFTSAKYFDLTIDGSPVEVNREIPLFFPWTLAYVLSVINSYALGYVFTAAIIDYATSTTSCTAPVGSGSSANGKVVVLTLRTVTGALLGTITYTLVGGIDELVCPNIIIPTNRILLETGNYVLLETGSYINLEY